MTDAGVATVPAGGPEAALTRPAVSLAPRYQKLFEGALLAIYVARPDGRLIACNRAFARMLGFDSVDDAVGHGMRDIFADASERARFVSRCATTDTWSTTGAACAAATTRFIDVIETAVGEFRRRLSSSSCADS
jgi:PAS domain-containing protein